MTNLIYPRERAIKILHKVRKHMLKMQKTDKRVKIFSQMSWQEMSEAFSFEYKISNYFRLQGIEEWISLELLLYDQQQRKKSIRKKAEGENICDCRDCCGTFRGKKQKGE